MRILLLAAMVAAAPAGAQMYQCTLADGKVVFQDHACASAQAQTEVQVRVPKPSGDEEPQRRLRKWMEENSSSDTQDALYGVDTRERRHQCAYYDKMIQQYRMRRGYRRQSSSDRAYNDAQIEWYKARRAENCR